MRARLEQFLFKPASPLGVIVARTVLAMQALWILASRAPFDLLTGWPAVFWRHASPNYVRYFIIPGAVMLDRALMIVLLISLAAALFGVCSRLACLASALLLFHFAPMEAVMGGIPYTTSLLGLTLPLLGLFVLSLAPAPRLRGEWSADYRWPLVIIQVLLAFHYLNSGLGKLHWAGLRWYSPANVGNLAITFWMMQKPLLSFAVWQQRWLTIAVGAGAFIIEFGFPLTLVSKWSRRILVPLALIAAILRIEVFGFFFLSVPSLLVMVNWDWIAQRLALASTTPSGQ